MRPRIRLTPWIFTKEILTTVLCVWGSLALVGQFGSASPLWAPFSQTFTSLVLFWPRRHERPHWAFPLMAFAQFTTLYVVYVGWGIGHGRSAIMSLANLAVALALVFAWRRINSGDDWLPGRAVDSVFFVGLLCLVGPALIALGGVSGLPAEDGWRGLLLWDARITVSNLVGQPATLVLFVPGREFVLRQRRSKGPWVGLCLSLPCLFLPFFVADYPLAWLIFIPAAWSGLTFTPRIVAIVSLLTAVAAIAGSILGVWGLDSGGGWLPSTVVLHTALGAAIGLAWLIVFQREDIAARTAALDLRRRGAAAQNRLLEGVFTTMNDGVLLADAQGQIRLANPAVRTLLGPDLPPDLSPAAWAARYAFVDPHGSGPLSPADLAQALTTDRATSTTLVVRAPGRRGKAGPILTLTNQPVVFRGSDHRFILVRDTTGAEERQAQLKAFAGAVAHDLKNPLAGLALWVESAQLSLASEDVGEGRSALRSAEAAADALRALIDDYLAHAVTRHGAIRPVVIAPGRVAAEIATAYPGLRLHIDSDRLVSVDPSLLRQLVRNLLDNAAKYARPGTVPTVHLSARTAKPGWVEVSLADRGVGLAPGDERRIFSSYTRGDGAADRRHGIGLGLALCEAIVARHGGSIRAEGNDWGGTTFHCLLPSGSLSVDEDADAGRTREEPVAAGSTAGR